MSKDTPQFGDVKIFNERSSQVVVHVQMANVQPDGSVVANGQIPQIHAPENTTQTPVQHVFGPGRPQGNCVLVSVYDATNSIELASFGPTGVACKLPGGALENVFDVVVRVLPADVVGDAEYCAVRVRLHYGAVVSQPSGRRSVLAMLKPGADVDRFVDKNSPASWISTLDGSMHVGVPSPAATGAKSVEQAPASDEFVDVWGLKLENAEPAEFSLVSLDATSPMPEPLMTAMMGVEARLTTFNDPIHGLLVVKLFHNDGAGGAAADVLDGWQIASAADGRLLSSTSNGAGLLRFLPRDAPEAFNQLWKITKSS